MDPGEVGPAVANANAPCLHVAVQLGHLVVGDPGDELHGDETGAGPSGVGDLG